MQNVELVRDKVEGSGEISSSSSGLTSDDGDGHEGGDSDLQEDRRSVGGGNDGAAASSPAETVLSIVISRLEEASALKVGAPPRRASVGVAGDKDDKLVAMVPTKKSMASSESYDEQCRVCQQQSDEPLMELGCRCRGELAKVHLSCIQMWFRTKGSNKCEICQQVAENVPSPESQPSTNYWIWRVDPAFGGPNIGQAGRERRCFSPIWVAFFILIGGLLLDALISVSLGVSALPVNIIIGVLIVLGLGTALRLALECCQEWTMRRNIVQRAADTAAVNSGPRPDV